MRFWFRCVVVLIFATPLASSAVVIKTGDGSGNTTPPLDDPGFANVGVTSTGLTGVFLGRDRWVITANHVGEVPITFNGVTYSPIEGSKVRIQNPDGPDADLMVYQVSEFPALPTLSLSSATPAPDEELYCIGNGWNRAPDETTWNIDWEEGVAPTAYRGFAQGGGKALRWGRNRVTYSGIDVRDTRSIAVEFDRFGSSTDEFQAVTGDSGGGCFAKRAGAWELVGVLFARSQVPDPNDGCPPGQQDPACNPPPPAQPSSTAAYTNLSFASDLYYYRDEIESNTPLPEIPALGPLGEALLGGLLAVSARGRLRRGPVARWSYSRCPSSSWRSTRDSDVL